MLSLSTDQGGPVHQCRRQCSPCLQIKAGQFTSVDVNALPVVKYKDDLPQQARSAARKVVVDRAQDGLCGVLLRETGSTTSIKSNLFQNYCALLYKIKYKQYIVTIRWTGQNHNHVLHESCSSNIGSVF